MSVSDAFNFRQADELVSTAGLLGEDQLRMLGPEGYEAVVNLLPHDSEYAVAGETGLVEAQGIAYIYIPVDFSAPRESDYRQFSDALSSLAGRKLLVHCAANYRVSAFYALYAHERLGWPESRARDFIASVWNLDEHPVWETFVSQMLGSSQR